MFFWQWRVNSPATDTSSLPPIATVLVSSPHCLLTYSFSSNFGPKNKFSSNFKNNGWEEYNCIKYRIVGRGRIIYMEFLFRNRGDHKNGLKWNFDKIGLRSVRLELRPNVRSIFMKVGLRLVFFTPKSWMDRPNPTIL